MGTADTVPGVKHELRVGDRVEYAGSSGGKQGIPAGRIGWIRALEPGHVLAWWMKIGLRRVATTDLRLKSPVVVRAAAESSNRHLWSLLGEELPQPSSGRLRDPYLEQGSHPDVVSRIWDELGQELPCDCRAQAKGRPVLAHPDTDRIIAIAQGTAYALWLVPDDYELALDSGADTVMHWSAGYVTDLVRRAGIGWIWG
ncbi:MAG: hypothetical protein QOD66_1463, partial [Solirubrobacteraceae bacterium]|nr:hypothetical protein [Solirubrobacteraceae bacterium]